MPWRTPPRHSVAGLRRGGPFTSDRPGGLPSAWAYILNEPCSTLEKNVPYNYLYVRVRVFIAPMLEVCSYVGGSAPMLEVLVGVYVYVFDFCFRISQV